jgi:signal transduction histidine kinase
VRSAAQGLAPVGDGGLADALAGLALLAADRVSIDVEGLHDPLAERAPDTSEATAMWFAANEAVTNALKHATGSHVRVRAMSSCSLEVGDDGPGGADPTGSGLAGIRDRLAAVGGRLGVASDDDGTRVTIEVPGRVRVGTYTEVGLVATTPAGTDSYGR